MTSPTDYVARGWKITPCPLDPARSVHVFRGYQLSIPRQAPANTKRDQRRHRQPGCGPGLAGSVARRQLGRRDRPSQ